MVARRPRTAAARARAVLRQQCPRCLRGRLFSTLWAMYRHCPVCGLEYEREPGYFLGAMYFSYALSILVGAPTLVLLIAIGVAAAWNLVVVGLQLALCSPLLYRYSRALWLHFDQVFDPR